LTQAGEHPWVSRFLKIWQRPQKLCEQDTPIYTHIYRGWDHTNHQWQQVIWPKLDSKLQPSPGGSGAVWKLDWQGGGETEAQAQGSSTGLCAESSFAVKAQTEESNFLGTSGKGKARALEKCDSEYQIPGQPLWQSHYLDID
jgi:hypothetical protein